MPPATPRPPAEMESFTATVSLRGQTFPFVLCTRPVRLGPDLSVQYYWVDSSGFRSLDTPTAQANFQSCVGHWAAAMRSMGVGDDLDQQVHYVLAVCYALVSSGKGMQAAYRDAYLGREWAVAADRSLSDEDRLRINGVVASRSSGRVQQELDRALDRFDAPAHVLPLMQEALRRWVGTGVVRLRRDGNDGLEQFLGEVDGWLQRYRRRQGNPWLRHFLNLFAYECKASFYTCYANAWIDLIPWLREHRGLDDASERFLRFWHMQNQPVEPPAGGHPPGRGNHRDVFNGQVLSLHPLSAVFMRDAGLCAVAGRFFGTEAYDRVFVDGQRDRVEYWDLLGAILAAANLYRQAQDAQEAARGTRQRPLAVAPAVDATPQSEAGLLEEMLAGGDRRCVRCGGPLRVVDFQPADDGGDFGIDAACRTCRQTGHLQIPGDELTAWLTARG